MSFPRSDLVAYDDFGASLEAEKIVNMSQTLSVLSSSPAPPPPPTARCEDLPELLQLHDEPHQAPSDSDADKGTNSNRPCHPTCPHHHAPDVWMQNPPSLRPPQSKTPSPMEVAVADTHRLSTSHSSCSPVVGLPLCHCPSVPRCSFC